MHAPDALTTDRTTSWRQSWSSGDTRPLDQPFPSVPISACGPAISGASTSSNPRRPASRPRRSRLDRLKPEETGVVARDPSPAPWTRRRGRPPAGATVGLEEDPPPGATHSPSTCMSVSAPRRGAGCRNRRSRRPLAEAVDTERVQAAVVNPGNQKRGDRPEPRRARGRCRTAGGSRRRTARVSCSETQPAAELRALLEPHADRLAVSEVPSRSAHSRYVTRASASPRAEAPHRTTAESEPSGATTRSLSRAGSSATGDTACGTPANPACEIHAAGVRRPCRGT